MHPCPRPPPKCLTLPPFFVHLTLVGCSVELCYFYLSSFCLKHEHKEDSNSSRVNGTVCSNAFVFEVRLNLSSSNTSVSTPTFPPWNPSPSSAAHPQALTMLAVFREQDLLSSFHEIVQDWKKAFKTPKNEFLRI